MKALFLGAALFALLMCFYGVTPQAMAQQSPCQANPDPVDASDPSIVVSTPASGASATSPLHVTGQARVFEATVSLTLYNSSGTEIASTTTNATEDGVLSPFSVDLPFTAAANPSACLWVFEASARDGSPTNVVQVPLTLNAAGLPPTGTGGYGTDQTLWLWFGTMAGLGVVAGTGALVLRRR